VESLQKEYKCPVCGMDWTHGYLSTASFVWFIGYHAKFRCSGCKQVFEVKKVLEM